MSARPVFSDWSSKGPRPLRRALPLVSVVALLAFSPGATALEIPYLTGRVNDLAGMIPGDVQQRVEETLAALENDTGAQMAVLTVPSLEGENLEDFSLRVAETWGLGRKEHDDGVLFLIARDDRKMRLEVGYGLESRLPDALCGRILDNVVRPEFRAGRFGDGIEQAVNLVATAVRGEAVDVPESDAGGSGGEQMPWFARLIGLTLFTVVVGTFSIVALFGKGCQGWFLWAFLIPFWTAFPAALIHPYAAGVTFLGWVIGFPILKLLLHKSTIGKSWLKAHPGWTKFATSSGHSGGGGWSSSGGGFSGGGGSFGGGGSSSSW